MQNSQTIHSEVPLTVSHVGLGKPLKHTYVIAQSSTSEQKRYQFFDQNTVPMSVAVYQYQNARYIFWKVAMALHKF